MIKINRIALILLGSLGLSHAANALSLKEIVDSSGQQKEASVAAAPAPQPQRAKGTLAKMSAAPPLMRLDKKDVEAKIQRELQGQYGDSIEVVFASWQLPTGAADQTSEFIVEEIEVNEQRTKIGALVHFQMPSGLKSLKVRGRLEHMIDVPTLNRPVHYGEKITKEDITWTKIPGRKAGRLLITTPEELIDRQPKAGFLKVHTPLYHKDVMRVLDIEKGSMVTVRYKTDKLELITKARALEPGHTGETIRILNPDTDKILHGEITGPNAITLTTG